MGYNRDHAIVVSSFLLDAITAAHTKAHGLGLGDLTTPPVNWRINGGASFAVLPDGSKEGWHESDAADTQRAAFIAWMRTTCYPDGSAKLNWVEVQFGNDQRETRALQSSDDDRAAQEARDGS